MKTTTKRTTNILLFLVLLTGCSAMPDLAITPISADMQNGGSRETAVKEDNMIKVQTGDSKTIKYESDTVEQIFNDIQEYPSWLVWAFAVAMGIAIPSPLATYGAWSRRRDLKKQINMLTKMLEATPPKKVGL